MGFRIYDDEIFRPPRPVAQLPIYEIDKSWAMSQNIKEGDTISIKVAGSTYQHFEVKFVNVEPKYHEPCSCPATYQTLRRIEQQFGVRLAATMEMVADPDASKWCSPCGIRICFWCNGYKKLKSTPH